MKGFSCCFFTFEEPVTSYFSCIGVLAATLFTPETPKVFFELKHFMHPSIAKEVSR